MLLRSGSLWKVGSPSAYIAIDGITLRAAVFAGPTWRALGDRSANFSVHFGVPSDIASAGRINHGVAALGRRLS